MKPTFRKWLEANRERYRTVNGTMPPGEFIKASLDDLCNAFADYIDEVLAERLKDRE